MRDILVTLVVFGGLPFILMRPYIGILMWAWISYMNPHKLGWGFAYNMPFAAMIGALTLFSLIFSKDKLRLPVTSVTVVWLLFIAWMCITTFAALIPDDAWVQWDKVMKIQFMSLITLMVFRSRERIHALVWVIALSIGFFGFKGGIFTILTGGNDLVLGPPGTFIGGNNELALAILMILPLMWYLFLESESKWYRRGLAVAMALCSFSVVASYSRGAFLAGAAICVFLWLKSSKKAVIGVGLLTLVPVLLLFMPDKWFDRMNTIQTYNEDSSALGRINAWRYAYNLASDRLLAGGGFGAFDKELFLRYAPIPDDFHDAHSIYFEILGEQGFVGLALFLSLGFLTWRLASRIIRQTKSDPHQRWAYNLASMVQVSLVGYAVGGAFLGLAYFDLYYHLIVILVATYTIIAAPSDEPSTAAETADPKPKGQAGLPVKRINTNR